MHLRIRVREGAKEPTVGPSPTWLMPSRGFKPNDRVSPSLSSIAAPACKGGSFDIELWLQKQHMENVRHIGLRYEIC